MGYNICGNRSQGFGHKVGASWCSRARVRIPAQHNIKYLPPYSPFLNICENAFSIWKQALKTRLAEVREQTLDQPFDERMATLTQLAVVRGPTGCISSNKG
ncbi:hypothetical protein ElyMa_001303600 [Elysia marginata]|uniref:Tc1-like transposase DDE domain-containing protein n=1 Tax=Elysia marginata TaxID=1093978 RepID=A0AAV4IIV4_9GAST|nr:hypothetical protein ElyMa_001303600 [Elysia marginata]